MENKIGVYTITAWKGNSFEFFVGIVGNKLLVTIFSLDPA